MRFQSLGPRNIVDAEPDFTHVSPETTSLRVKHQLAASICKSHLGLNAILPCSDRDVPGMLDASAARATDSKSKPNVAVSTVYEPVIIRRETSCGGAGARISVGSQSAKAALLA